MATLTTRHFELTGADGGPLRGDVRTAGDGKGRPVVVICHGFKGFKDWGFFPHLATRAARAGMTAVSFNFSGSGVGPDGESFSEPERFARQTFSNDLEDLRIVFDAIDRGQLVPGLAARPAEVYGLFGHSRGGGVAALYAAAYDAVGALVTWSAIANVLRWDDATVAEWRSKGSIDIVNARTGDILPLRTDVLDDIMERGDALDIERAARQMAIPWLIVHGDGDEAVPVSDARRLEAAASGKNTELRIISGGSHTFGARHPWGGDTPELNAAMDATVDWFTRHLL